MDHISGVVLLSIYWCLIVTIMLVSYGSILLSLYVKDVLQRRTNRLNRTHNKISAYQMQKNIQI